MRTLIQHSIIAQRINHPLLLNITKVRILHFIPFAFAARILICKLWTVSHDDRRLLLPAKTSLYLEFEGYSHVV